MNIDHFKNTNCPIKIHCFGRIGHGGYDTPVRGPEPYDPVSKRVNAFASTSMEMTVCCPDFVSGISCHYSKGILLNIRHDLSKGVFC